MLSRIADTLFWIGRYVERAENTARLLQVNYFAIAEAPVDFESQELLDSLWLRVRAMNDDAAEFDLHYPSVDERSVVEWLGHSPLNPLSIRSSLTSARENARSVRFHLNLEMWEALNRAYNDLLTGGRGGGDLGEYCSSTREACHLFFGIAEATLPRAEGWHFLSAGRYLERADNVLRLLEVQYGEQTLAAFSDRVLEDHRSRAFLRSVGAYEAYRKRQYVALEPALIADFLLLDETFPRSVRWSALRLHEALNALAHLNPGASGDPARLAGWLSAQLQYLPGVTQVIQQERPGLSELVAALAEIGDTIDAAYFSHGGPNPMDSIPQQQQQQQ